MGGASKEQKAAAAAQAEASRRAMLLEEERAGLQRQIFSLIQPYGSKLLDVGSMGLRGEAPDFLLRPARDTLAGAFSQGRENLVEMLGSTGQFGSGVGAAPLGNLEIAHSRALADARTQAILAALGLGQQGANILSGVASQSDPLGALQAGIGANQSILQFGPRGGFLQSLLGSAAGAGFRTLFGPTGQIGQFLG